MKDQETTPRRMFPGRLGPCRLIEPIGAGGMGTVYVAELAEPRPYAGVGSRVAVKVVHPERLETSAAVERFRREAALGTQVEHLGVVRTFEAGIEVVGDLPHHYLVMEYVEGRSVRTVLRELGTIPEPLTRDIAQQVARALAAVHAVGAIHRDIKPENVVITPDQRVKLVDFGVARMLGSASDLTTSGVFLGTLRYAAPELIRNEPAGPATDLYALGVMLYEMVTSEAPFIAENAEGLFHMHLHAIPARVSRLNPDVSPFFEEVIVCLLEKDPSDRLASATELADVLDRDEQSQWWIGRHRAKTADIRSSRMPLIPVRVDAPLAGRARELGVLRNAFERTREGRGGLVLLTGEAGSGKSRLLAELVRMLDESREVVRVLYGASSPLRMGGAQDALAQALASQFGGARLEAALARYLGSLRRMARSFEAAVTGVDAQDGVEKPTAEALHALYPAIAHGLASERPTVWIVEDLHFASPLTRDVILSMARAAANERILIVVTSRPTLPAEYLGHLDRIEGTRRLALDRLPEPEVRALLADLLHSTAAADRLGPMVAARSDGNPLFVLALVETLREQGMLAVDEHGSCSISERVADLQVPTSITELLAAPLEDLRDDERAVVDVAAVQGYEFEPDLIARVLGRERLAVLQSLAAMERRSGLVRPKGRGFRFDHHLLQEVLYEAVPLALRTEYHALVAAAYEERAGLASVAPEHVPGESAAFLAHHYLAGDRTASGLRTVLPALDWLVAQYRSEAALSLAQRALGVVPAHDAGLAVELNLRAAAALDVLGRTSDQAAAIDAAIERAARAGDDGRLARALGEKGWLLLWKHDYAGAAAALEEARERARSVGDVATESRAISNLGLVHQQLGDHEEARRLHSIDLALARERGDPRGQGRAMLNLGLVLLRIGNPDEAREHVAQSLAFFASDNHRAGEGLAGAMLGDAFRSVGRNREAREHLERSLELCRDIAYRHGETHARLGLGVLSLEEGRLADAGMHLGRGLELARELHERRLEARGLLAAGDLARARDERAEARSRYEESLAIVRRLGHRAAVADASFALGRECLEEGDVERACALLEEAESISKELALWEPGPCATALLATLGRRRVEDVVVGVGMPVMRRAETHLLLHRAGAGGDHVSEARRLLAGVCAQLPPAEHETFWDDAVTARAVRAEVATLDAPGSSPTS